MRSKVALFTLFALIAFLGTLGLAQAQPVPMTPEVHNQLTHGGTIPNGMGAQAPGAQTSQTVVSQDAGWNYVHATHCNGYYDGSTTWLYVYPQEGGYWYTSNPSLQNTMAPACQTGNWLAFYVYDTNGSRWNQVYTFIYK